MSNATPSVHARQDLAQFNGAGIVGPMVAYSDGAIWDTGANKFVDVTKTDHQCPTPRK